MEVAMSASISQSDKTIDAFGGCLYSQPLPYFPAGPVGNFRATNWQGIELPSISSVVGQPCHL
jgi:hypothetical protein